MDLETALAAAKAAEEKANALEAQLDGLKKNNSSLVEEKRRETEQRQQLEEQAKQIARDLAKKNGDYEAVIAAADEERKAALERLSEFEQRIAVKEIKIVSQQIANEIAFDADAAELLQKLIAERLKYSDDEVKITNEKGEFVTAEDFKKELHTTRMFKALLKGTQATGGRPTVPTGRPGTNNPNPKDTLPAQERLHLAHEARNK